MVQRLSQGLPEWALERRGIQKDLWQFFPLRGCIEGKKINFVNFRYLPLELLLRISNFGPTLRPSLMHIFTFSGDIFVNSLDSDKNVHSLIFLSHSCFDVNISKKQISATGNEEFKTLRVQTFATRFKRLKSCVTNLFTLSRTLQW